MLHTAKAHRPRQIASWASLACVAVLLTACNSSTRSSSGPVTGAHPVSTVTAPGTVSTSGPVTSPTTPPSAPASSGPVTGPTTPPSAPALGATPTGAAIFLATEQSLNGTLHEPACGGYGCALSGDSTAFLSAMTWTTWSGSQAVGRGTYKLDDCDPNCAGGHVYSVATVVTLSQPVKVCASTGPRWVWSHASFAFPAGLPKALQGQNAPQNPWTFSGLITAAQQTCTT